MNMIRTFHPVGQGAFYSEEFFNSERGCIFRAVYDCGLCRVKPFPLGVYPIFFCRSGCLYTGDISLDDADLTMVFGRYVRNIGMVQLPHHGSFDSFGSGNLPIDGRVCVATYGEKNRFGHPAFVVKRAVAEKGGLWVDVTETDESRFKVEYTV